MSTHTDMAPNKHPQTNDEQKKELVLTNQEKQDSGGLASIGTEEEVRCIIMMLYMSSDSMNLSEYESMCSLRDCEVGEALKW